MFQVVIVFEGIVINIPLKGYNPKNTDTYEDLLKQLDSVVQEKIADSTVANVIDGSGKNVLMTDKIRETTGPYIAKIIYKRKITNILDRLYDHFRRNAEDIHYISIGSIVNYHMKGPSFERQQYPIELIKAAEQLGKMLHIYIIDPGVTDMNLAPFQIYNRLACIAESTAQDNITIYNCDNHKWLRIHTVPHMINITEEINTYKFKKISSIIHEANGGLLISWAGVALLHVVYPDQLQFQSEWISTVK